MTAREVVHVVNIPSNPPGWSAGKWGEWYPDILDRDGRLTINLPKPYWQSGWLKHCRFLRPARHRDRGWPSAFRGIGATPPVHLQMEENLKPAVRRRPRGGEEATAAGRKAEG
jgi:hypothetical protein